MENILARFTVQDRPSARPLLEDKVRDDNLLCLRA
jgi:hypothetical protein